MDDSRLRAAPFSCLLALAVAALIGFSSLGSAHVPKIKVGPNLDISNEPGPQFETAIAINPNNPSQIVAGVIDAALPFQDVRAYFSSDGGATWGTTALPFAPPVVNGVAATAFDPGVAWDTQGNVYFSSGMWWFNLVPGFPVVTSAIQVDRSSDGGRTWTATDFGSHQGNAALDDKPLMAIDTNAASPFRDTIYVAWDVTYLLPPRAQTDAVPASFVLTVSRSTDHGATFSEPVLPLGHTGTGASRPYVPYPFVGPDGTEYIAYHDPAQDRFAVIASADGGQTFGPPTTIAPAVPTVFLPIPAEPHGTFSDPGLGPLGAFVYPACGADSSPGPSRGTLYCSWIDETATSGTDIFVAHSTDQGQTWSAGVRVNDDPSGVLNDQFAQWLAVDPTDGSVSLSWYDTRNDPSRLTTDVFYARSTDGGQTFSPNVQVTTAPTNETCATCGARFYGDYEGIAAFDGVVHVVWTDQRASVSAFDDEVFTATITVT